MSARAPVCQQRIFLSLTSNGLAGVNDLESNELIDVLLHEVGEGKEEAAAFLTAALRPPRVLEGLTSSLDCSVYILLAGGLNLMFVLEHRNGFHRT